MPITVTHGPITAALDLAQRAGQGEAWWRGFQADQQLLQNLDRRRAQALDLRRQTASEALAYDRMRQQERQFEDRLAQGAAEFEAQQAMQQRRLGLERKRERRLGKQFGAQLAQQRARGRRAQRGLELEEERLELSRQQEQRLGQPGGEPFVESAEARAMRERMKNLERRIETAQERLEEAVDPISERVGELEPRPEMEQQFNRALQSRMKLQKQLDQLRTTYDEQLQQATPDLPQYGAEAAQSGLAGRQAGGQTQQYTEEKAARIASALQALAQQLARQSAIRSIEDAERAALDALVARGGDPSDPEVQAAAQQLAQLTMELKGGA
jgi:hypothetical protein